MKNISSKQVLLYVVLLGALLLVAVYFLVYKSNMDKAETIKKSNTTLSQRVNELKVYYDAMEYYNGEISLMQTEIKDTLGKFPADVKEEDILVLAIETERNAAVGYKNINIGDREELYTIPSASVQSAGLEGLMSDLIFVERTTEYVNTTDYVNLKECIDTICKSNNRLVIEDIVYQNNEENMMLEGSIKVTFYSLIGSGREYVPQNLPAYESGLENLFGVRILEEPEAEPEAGAETE